VIFFVFRLTPWDLQFVEHPGYVRTLGAYSTHSYAYTQQIEKCMQLRKFLKYDFFKSYTERNEEALHIYIRSFLCEASRWNVGSSLRNRTTAEAFV